MLQQPETARHVERTAVHDVAGSQQLTRLLTICHVMNSCALRSAAGSLWLLTLLISSKACLFCLRNLPMVEQKLVLLLSLYVYHVMCWQLSLLF